MLCSTTTQVIKEVATVPVWAKLTPATADIAEEAGATFRGGADAIVSEDHSYMLQVDVDDVDALRFEVLLNQELGDHGA